VKANRLHPDMASKFDLQVLADTLNIERDELFQYAGLDGLINRYMIKGIDQNPLETAQYFFMRISLWVFRTMRKILLKPQRNFMQSFPSMNTFLEVRPTSQLVRPSPLSQTASFSRCMTT
jgi:ribonucleotide reductase alpha subunit